ncbi:MAG: hypothetical protein MHM6MM_001284 [Cercozoa sp. M6MM]
MFGGMGMGGMGRRAPPVEPAKPKPEGVLAQIAYYARLHNLPGDKRKAVWGLTTKFGLFIASTTALVMYADKACNRAHKFAVAHN